MSISIELRRLRMLMSVLVLLAVLPSAGQAGLYTSPFGPTYNVGPEAAFMNPAGLTYSFGAAGVFSGGAPVSQMTQGAQFTGRFKTNVAVVLGGSLQWRF